MQFAEQTIDSEFFTTEKQYSDFNKNEDLGVLNKGLWEVDDRLSSNPSLRFQREGSPLIDLIYDGGAQPMLEGVRIPKQCILFLKQWFLSKLRIPESEVVSIEDIAQYAFSALDYEDPYFFLSDMPISLSQDNYSHTYIHKKTRSTLNPEKLEIFKVQFGWNFPYYMQVHKLLAHPMAEEIARGRFVAHPSGTRNMDIVDVMRPMFAAVCGSWEYSKGLVEHWMTNYYDGLKYDLNNGDLASLEKIEIAQERDLVLWLAVSLGVVTWLKSPHGLRFLMHVHPIYESVLEWNEDTNRPMVAKDSGGYAVVDGWTVYTARDLELRENIKPGTCEVSGQTLHCTRLVNVHAVMHKCFCGKQRDPLNADEYGTEKGHSHPSCRQWRDLYGAPQMRFISYAALDNQLSGRDPDTRCQRHSCPTTDCKYHAGYAARIQALTNNRARMLTGTRSH
jgi:hypothetical protein